MTDVDLQVWGEGDPVVLVHGSLDTGPETWQGQRALADRGHRLLVMSRRGYRPPYNGRGEDYLLDARDVRDLLGDGAHLVGHSYGALAAIVAASERPRSVRSLTVIEPPAFGVCPADAAVAAFVARLEGLSIQRDVGDREYLKEFLGAIGAAPDEIPDEMLATWLPRVPLLRRGRPAWTAELPLDRLAGAGVPTLVVSGGHDAAFEAVCDALVERLHARKATIPGAGHEVPMMADDLNHVLLGFWSDA